MQNPTTKTVDVTPNDLSQLSSNCHSIKCVQISSSTLKYTDTRNRTAENMSHMVQRCDVYDGNNQCTVDDGKSCYNFYCLRRRWSKSAMSDFCSCCECKKRNKLGKMFGMAWMADEDRRRVQPTSLTINYLSTPSEIQEKFEDIINTMKMNNRKDYRGIKCSRRRCVCPSPRRSERPRREPHHRNTSPESDESQHRNNKDLVQHDDEYVKDNESTSTKTIENTNNLDISKPVCTCIETSSPRNCLGTKAIFITTSLINLLLLLLTLWIMCSYLNVYPCNQTCKQKYTLFTRCK